MLLPPLHLLKIDAPDPKRDANDRDTLCTYLVNEMAPIMVDNLSQGDDKDARIALDLCLQSKDLRFTGHDRACDAVYRRFLDETKYGDDYAAGDTAHRKKYILEILRTEDMVVKKENWLSHGTRFYNSTAMARQVMLLSSRKNAKSTFKIWESFPEQLQDDAQVIRTAFELKNIDIVKSLSHLENHRSDARFMLEAADVDLSVFEQMTPQNRLLYDTSFLREAMKKIKLDVSRWSTEELSTEKLSTEEQGSYKEKIFRVTRFLLSGKLWVERDSVNWNALCTRQFAYDVVRNIVWLVDSLMPGERKIINIDIAREILQSMYLNLLCLDDHALQDRELLLLSTSTLKTVYEKMSYYIKIHRNCFHQMEKQIRLLETFIYVKKDEEMTGELRSLKSDIIFRADTELWDFEDFAIWAVTVEPSSISEVSKRLRDDVSFVRKAIVANSEAWVYIDNEMRQRLTSMG